MATKATTKRQEYIPKGEWPGAWDIYQHSKRAVLRNWQLLLGLIALSIFISMIVDALFGQKETQYFSDLLAYLLGAVIGLLLTIVYFASIRGKQASFSDTFAKFDPILYLKYVGTSIVTALLSLLAFMALVVPFFFVFPRLVMAAYLVVDKGLGPIEAVKQSWLMTEGHIGKIWGIIGATLVMALPILTIIGTPFALYFIFMYQIAMIVLYEFLQKKK